MNAQEFITKFGIFYSKDDDCLYDKNDDEVELMSESLEDRACPACGDREQLRVVTTSWAEMTEDGTNCQCCCEYDSSSLVNCQGCGHDGELRNFTIVDLDSQLRSMRDEGQNVDNSDDDQKEDPAPPPALVADAPPPPPVGSWDTSGI
jgi:hypothetical protein